MYAKNSSSTVLVYSLIVPSDVKFGQSQFFQ
jgi:hypothetical protein